MKIKLISLHYYVQLKRPLMEIWIYRISRKGIVLQIKQNWPSSLPYHQAGSKDDVASSH